MTLFRNVREAMLTNLGTKTKPKLVICEMLLRDTSPRFVRTTSMQLLALNGGANRTEREVVMLLEKSGFKVEKIHHMRAVDSIVEATPV
jgi:hypothetical protein